MKEQSKFSHVSNFTDYMAVVVQTVSNFFNGDLTNKKILDISAGNGLVSSQLKKLDSSIVSADIEKHLPFDDKSFETVICLEVIEHVLHPEIIKNLFSIKLLFSRFLVFKVVKN